MVALRIYVREHLFGEADSGQTGLNNWGLNCRGHLAPDSAILSACRNRGAHRHAELCAWNPGYRTPCRGRPIPGSTGVVVGSFESTAKRIEQTCNAPGAPVWQRNYYEHATRNEEGLNAIRTYIQHNPTNWATDAENVWHARKHALNSL